MTDLSTITLDIKDNKVILECEDTENAGKLAALLVRLFASLGPKHLIVEGPNDERADSEYPDYDSEKVN